MPSISESVQLCCSSYYTAVSEQMAKPVMKRNFDHLRAAYFRHIPFLSDAENIRAFIACVGHGMLIGAIHMQDGAKLLYAAQVARSALPREIRPAGRPPKSASPRPEPLAPQSEKNTPTPSPAHPAPVQTAAPAAESSPSPNPADCSPRAADQREISAPPSQPENKYPTPSPAPPNVAPESENNPQNGKTRAPRSAPSEPSAPSAPPAAATPASVTTRQVA